MAGYHVVLFSALSLIPASSASVVLEDTHRGALIRRHPAESGSGLVETSRMINSQGELIQRAEASTDSLQGKRLKDRKGWSEQEPTFCDANYTFGQANSIVCPYGKAINSPEDCRTAAKLIGQNLDHETAPAEEARFEIKRYPTNPPPYPSDCFMMPDSKDVFYNPAYENTSNRSGGIPICERELYPAGTNGSKADDRCTVDGSGDWKPTDVSNDGYQDCVRAFNCTEGMSGCRDMHMYWMTHIQLDDAPPGCYREVGTGCFNFNWKSAPAGDTITGIPVCILKIRQNWMGGN